MRSHSFFAIEWIQVPCQNMFVLECQSTTTLITTFLEFSRSFFVEAITKIFAEPFLSSFLCHRVLVINHVKHVVDIIRLEIFTFIAWCFVCLIEWLLRLTLYALSFHCINSYLLDSILNVLLVTLSVKIWIHWTLVFQFFVSLIALRLCWFWDSSRFWLVDKALLMRVLQIIRLWLFWFI